MMLFFFINITKHLSERISNTFTANSLDDSWFYGNSKRLVKVQEMIKLFKWDNKVDFPLYYSGGKFSKLEILEQSSRNSGADSLLDGFCWFLPLVPESPAARCPRRHRCRSWEETDTSARLSGGEEKRRFNGQKRAKYTGRTESYETQNNSFNSFNFGVNERRPSHFITADQSSKKSPTLTVTEQESRKWSLSVNAQTFLPGDTERK